MQPGTAKALKVIIEAALRGRLDNALARKLHELGPEAVALAMLSTSKHIGEQNARLAQLADQGVKARHSPSTPSGMVPVYAKPNASKRRKRPGARPGHQGVRRARPVKIDERKTHRLKCCPDCGGKLQRCQRSRTRIIEDIPEVIEPVVTEHTIHRDFCPKCKRHVEPVVPNAMPKATLGHQVIALTSWFHYGLGLTIDQIVDILGYHLQTKLTSGGLVDAWRRLAEVLGTWHEQIGEQARTSAYLHADETGWRVNGRTQWLWCFTNDRNCYYMIDRSRGSPALQKFFTDEFEGVLITDFWSAYESVCAEDRQYCLVHLLRELEKVDDQNDSPEWQAFAKKLRRLLRDGIRLRKQDDFAPDKYRGRIDRLNKRLAALAAEEHVDGDARRLTKRLRKHAEYIFTFLDYNDVRFENNFAERQIRPAVILRKNSQSNRSDRGAASQAVLMSVYRTLRLRGLDPTQTIAEALKAYLATGQLPPLPTHPIADG
jgi:transposase